MVDVYSELKRIIESLNENEIDYAICGGWAMAIHGIPRATIDIDLLIPSELLEKTLEVARKNEYWLEGMPMSFQGGKIEIRRISKVDEETGFVLMLDLLLVTPEISDVWETKTKKVLENGVVQVVSKEGLIRLKTISGRTQDKADIEKLLEIDDEN